MTGLLFDLKSSVTISSVLSVSRSCRRVTCIPDLMHLSMLGRRGGRRGKGAGFDEKVYPVSGEFDDQYSPGGRGI